MPNKLSVFRNTTKHEAYTSDLSCAIQTSRTGWNTPNGKSDLAPLSKPEACTNEQSSSTATSFFLKTFSSHSRDSKSDSESMSDAGRFSNMLLVRKRARNIFLSEFQTIWQKILKQKSSNTFPRSKSDSEVDRESRTSSGTNEERSMRMRWQKIRKTTTRGSTIFEWWSRKETLMSFAILMNEQLRIFQSRPAKTTGGDIFISG